MYCSKCGKLVDDNVTFCPYCGANLGKEVESIKVDEPNKAKYPPENYLIWAILSTLFCCWPVGIVSIVHASKVESAFNRGDYDGALEASQKAKKWALISAISAGIFWVLYCLLIVVLAAMGELQFDVKRIFLIGFLSVVLILMGVIYFYIDPSKSLMPRCPFFSLTGYLCPGCGSQRAVHALLHLEFSQAFMFNPLLVLSLPYIALGVLVFLFEKSNKYVLWFRLNLYGRYAVYVWGVLIVLYWIFRNL